MNDTAKCAVVGCSSRESCLHFVRPVVDGQQWIDPKWVDYLIGDIGAASRCLRHQPIPVEPHGGAQEEGDAC